jgi:NADH:ubiquinone oxidoreductase subunit E
MSEDKNTSSLKGKEVKRYILEELIKKQKDAGSITDDIIIELSKKLKIPVAIIYEVVTFYSFLKYNVEAKHIIRVCKSPSCYLNGSMDILKSIKDLLAIDVNETTKDKKFMLKTTSCIGCCDKPPAMMVGDVLYTDLTEEKIREILEKCN